MPETVSIVLAPREAANLEAIHSALGKRLGRQIAADRFVIVRRSVDARKRSILVNLGIRVYADGEALTPEQPDFCYRDVHSAPPVVIVGAGPAGLFAALRLMELGLRPVVVERGKPIQDRRRDVAALNRRGVLVEENNHAVGGGGGGKVSGGQIYNPSKKTGGDGRGLHPVSHHRGDPRTHHRIPPHTP